MRGVGLENWIFETNSFFIIEFQTVLEPFSEETAAGDAVLELAIVHLYTCYPGIIF